MYKCPTCGAGLVFDPTTQKLQCLSCRNQYNPEEIEKLRLDQARENENQQSQDNEYVAISYKCSHCGAELITTDETITTFCSFCRTGTMVDKKFVRKRKPDFVIPFSISKKECEEIYINKIKNSIFAPKSMIEEQEVKKIRGIYMPYWIYNFEKHGSHEATGSKYSHRSGDYKYYDDFSLTTDIDAECNGIIHDATSNFSDRLSESIAPYSVKEKKEFIPSYLSGFYADNEDVDPGVYMEDSNNIASEYISKNLGKDKTYHKYKSKPEVYMEKKEPKLALFPVYFLATKNKREDRISYAVVNGQTGKIAADIPIDMGKFILYSLVLAIPMFIILNILFTFTMGKLIFFSILFNLISMFILIKQNKKIHAIENNTEDKGERYNKTKEIDLSEKIEHVNKYNKKKRVFSKNKGLEILLYFFLAFLVYGFPLIISTFINILNLLNIDFGTLIRWIGIIGIIVFLIIMIAKSVKAYDKDSSIYKQALGLIITFSVFCFKPAEDIYYYLSAIVSILLTILSFFDIVKKYNLYTTRKLPQLERRGGDENA